MMSTPFVRTVKDWIMYAVGIICIIMALVPLGSILYEVVVRGLPAINLQFFTSTPGPVGQPGGGIAQSIQGTLIIVGLTCLIAVPLGLFTGIYLSEYGDNQYGRTVRFLNDVLTEFPSIVVGILAFSLIVLTLRSFAAIAGAVALSFIMMPVVARTTEESLKLVPSSIRDAAAALGVRKWRTTFSIVLSTGRSGVITGVLLAVARISGETAPLILTILGSSVFFAGFDKPMDALPLRIYRYAFSGYPNTIQQGWGAALILILIVLTLNVTVRIATRGRLYGRRSNRL